MFSVSIRDRDAENSVIVLKASTGKAATVCVLCACRFAICQLQPAAHKDPAKTQQF